MAPLTQYLSGLLKRTADEGYSLSALSDTVKRSLASTLDAHVLKKRNSNYDPGHGATPGTKFNRDLFIVLFSVISAGMVISAIYFFFIAKNGGFQWKETDWDDYKTTVLRRKGPDGETLSNATKSTKLGGGSVVGKWDEAYTQVSQSTADPEMGEVRHSRAMPTRHKNNRHDADFNDYRYERPAAVGGYNKPDEGSHYTGSNTERSRSEVSSAHKSDKKSKKDRERREKDAKKKAAKDQKRHKSRDRERERTAPDDAAAAPLTAPPEETAYTNYSDASYASPSSNVYGVPQQSPQSYYSSYRPSAPTMRTVPAERTSTRSTPSGTYRHTATGGSSRQGSPRKQHREQSAYVSDTSYTGSGSDVGTKAYPCHIPGVSKGPAQPPPSLFSGRDEVRPDESVSQIGIPTNQRKGTGFRRGR